MFDGFDGHSLLFDLIESISHQNKAMKFRVRENMLPSSYYPVNNILKKKVFFIYRFWISRKSQLTSFVRIINKLCWIVHSILRIIFVWHQNRRYKFKWNVCVCRLFNTFSLKKTIQLKFCVKWLIQKHKISVSNKK